ncbi:MAG TPA: HAD hydrolase family protein [Gemmatimonadales bacterium]|nr:HAD hydrolase family protein [Gemmatimonadales bacterium]
MLDAALARRVRLVGLDVDGVLTDNGIWVGPVNGVRVELKRFDIQDGLGIGMLRLMGLSVVLVSGRESEATALRAAELGCECIQDAKAQKVPALGELLARRGLGWDEVAFVGDDLADLPVLERVGLPIAVANAVPEVKRAARFVTGASGGHGAVREVIEALLKARGEWEEALRRYLRQRDPDYGHELARVDGSG